MQRLARERDEELEADAEAADSKEVTAGAAALSVHLLVPCIQRHLDVEVITEGNTSERQHTVLLANLGSALCLRVRC